MLISRTMVALGSSLALLALAACGTSYPYQHKQIQVQSMTESAVVPFTHSKSRLEPDAKAELAALMARVKPLSVQSVIVQANPKNRLSMARANAIRAHLTRAGVVPSAFRVQSVRQVVPEVLVEVEHTTALPPSNCPDWKSRGTPNFGNEPFSNYRCSTLHNLARQVADPRDLVRGHGRISGDADRNQVVITNYKSNTVTAPIVTVGEE